MSDVRKTLIVPLLMYLALSTMAAAFSDSVALLATGFVLGQGFALWGLLHIVRSFSRDRELLAKEQKEWTRALLYAHETGQMINRSNVKILEALEQRPAVTKGAA
jgi:hypothetical protein